MPLFNDHSASEILNGGSLSAAMTGREPAAAMAAGGNAGGHGRMIPHYDVRSRQSSRRIFAPAL
jgi:hypothetical protein